VFVTSGVVDTHKSECDDNMADIEAWESNDQVWMVFGLLTHVTEIFPGILQRRQRGKEATPAWRCSSPRDPLPNHI